MGSSSLTRDGTWVSCIESMESSPLDPQGSPQFLLSGSWLVDLPPGPGVKRSQQKGLNQSSCFLPSLGSPPRKDVQATSAHQVLPIHSSSAHFLSFSEEHLDPCPLFCLHLSLQQVSVGPRWGRALALFLDELGTPARKQAQSHCLKLCAEKAEPWSWGRAESGWGGSHMGVSGSQAAQVSQVGTQPTQAWG